MVPNVGQNGLLHVPSLFFHSVVSGSLGLAAGVLTLLTLELTSYIRYLQNMVPDIQDPDNTTPPSSQDWLRSLDASETDKQWPPSLSFEPRTGLYYATHSPLPSKGILGLLQLV